jgi:hypothetical protein
VKKFTISILYFFSYLFILFGLYEFVVPLYGYRGFSWHINEYKVAEGLFFSLFIPLFLPAKFKQPSDVLVHVLLLFPIIPMLVLYGAEDYPRLYMYCTVMAYFLIVFIVSLVDLKPVRIVRISPIAIQGILLVLSYVTIAIIIMFGGLKYLNFNILKVYEYRSGAASILPSAFGYISPWVSKVLLPFSLMLAIVNKNLFLAFLSLLGSILMFALTNHKGPLLYPFFVMGLYYVLSYKNVIKAMLIGYIFIVLLSIISFLYMDGLIGSFMLRRSYLVPAHLNFIYYEYFSANPLVWWSQSKITFGLLDYPYDIDTSHLIGRVYYNNDLTGANTGWIGSAYMNAGIFGMFIYAVIIALFMAVLNSFNRIIDKRVVVSIVTGPIISLILSSDLPTAFLNHGVLLSVVLLSLFSNRFNGKDKAIIGRVFK